MKRTLRTRAALVTAVSLSLVGAVAGCASTTSASSSTGASSNDTSSSSGSSATSTSDDATSYKDGTYSADGSYVSPGGQEEIAVTITVKDDLITAVSVKTVSADPEGEQYEAQFASGISAVAVGKSLSSLSVGSVAGSSLTSQGFNRALSAIRGKAKA
ncbi:MAG TPA: hypothetical protein VK537_04190 [Galbitalea sp.]|nr:hypothetical protein [Galbitalea sp.]